MRAPHPVQGAFPGRYATCNLMVIAWKALVCRSEVQLPRSCWACLWSRVAGGGNTANDVATSTSTPTAAITSTPTPSATPNSGGEGPSPVANIAPETAQEISELPFVTEADTSQAPDGGPSCGFFGLTAAVWYRVTPQFEGHLLATTEGSDFDTVLSVWVLEGAELVERSCNDDSELLTSAVIARVEPGVTYYLQVAAIGPGGELRLAVDRIEGEIPANTGPATAETIAGLPFFEVSDTSLAPSAQHRSSCAFFGLNGVVWYEFTPELDSLIRATTSGSNYDTVLSVWTDDGGELTEVVCNDDAERLTSAVVASVTAGVRYYLQIGGHSTGGELHLSVAPADGGLPGNVAVDSAEVITSLPFDTVADTSFAPSGDPRPSCAFFGVGATVWYRFSSERAGQIRVTTAGSDYDTVLSVWIADGTELTEVACNDDAGNDDAGNDDAGNDDAGPLTSEVVAPVEPGVTYYLQVAALQVGAALGGGGEMHLSVASDPPE